LYFLLPATFIQIDCFNQDSASAAQTGLSAPEIVALVYRGFFLLVCLALAVAFAFYTYKVISRLRGGSTTIKQKPTSRIMKMTIAATVCVFSLLAQAINLIVSVFTERGATVAIVVLLVIETVPALLFLFLFARKGSLSGPSLTVTSSSRGVTKSKQSKTGEDSSKRFQTEASQGSKSPTINTTITGDT